MTEGHAMRCPVCAGEARAVMAIGANEIGTRLAQEMPAPVPEALAIADYEMRECASCGLVFADPMQSGDAPYYEWVTGFPQYHASARWEWRAMRRLLKGRGHARILDIGCGDGTFLAFVADLPGIEVLGIDLSAANVERARARGVNARHASLEDLGKKGTRFDVVSMSHVLEHVADPLLVIESAKQLLNMVGQVVTSGTFSSSSRERPKPDIMN